jgi:hypothetical protein
MKHRNSMEREILHKDNAFCKSEFTGAFDINLYQICLKPFACIVPSDLCQIAHAILGVVVLYRCSVLELAEG